MSRYCEKGGCAKPAVVRLERPVEAGSAFCAEHEPDMDKGGKHIRLENVDEK